MSKIKVIIADDELPARKKMKRMLEKFDQIELVHMAENGLDALESIKKENPDLVFLDIEMPGITGIEVAEQLNAEMKNELPHIVFATAYNEHAIKAFELNAIDYLLKPFNEERLGQTIEKIMKDIESGDAGNSSEKISGLSETGETLPFSTKIPVAMHDRYLLIDFDDVIAIEVEERNTILYEGKNNHTMNQTLDYFEKKLPDDKFLRVNRASLIGLQHVKEIVIWFGNRFKIIMKNGKEVISSREKSKILKQVLKF